LKDIQRIISDLEQQQAAIARAIAALREVGGDAAAGVRKTAAKSAAPRKRRISPEGRARISAAAKARWAAERAKKAAAAQAQAGKKRAARKRNRPQPAPASE
jgi:hypothetical protein